VEHVSQQLKKQSSSEPKMYLRTLILILSEVIACHGSPLTNSFPNDEAAYNMSRPRMIWGQATNFETGNSAGQLFHTTLRSGLDSANGEMLFSIGGNLCLNSTRLCLENCFAPSSPIQGTNLGGVMTFTVPLTNWTDVYLPPVGERLVLSMTDTNNVPVQKTSRGVSMDAPSNLKSMTSVFSYERGDHQRLAILPGGIVDIPFFDRPRSTDFVSHHDDIETLDLNPGKYFILNQPGLFKLTVTQRLYIVDTNLYLEAVTLPPVSINVQVSK